MGVINVLDFSVANLIAAGEVVDRPASAIKELLENSLDAGAKHISVEIKNGGSSLMRVSDDGCGMSRDDVPVCIRRHATSKIHSADDLDGIMSLGFRGEALAAIASVSKLRIITKTADSLCGTQLVCDCGEIKEISDAGCHDGTTVIVEELFANTPARRKFLKRDMTEAMAVSAVVEKLALSRPDVAFHFICDGNVRIDTSGDGKLANAIYSVLGRDFAKKMIAVSGMTEGISVDGFISSPDNVRGNRNYQNFFINSRYIKSNAVTSALEEAYSSYIPTERFPSCVLNLVIHPAFVDVNVHPAKLEVKFSNDRYVFNAVYCAVRNALTEHIKRPEMELRGGAVMTGRDVRVINAFTSIDDKVTEEEEKKERQPNLFDPGDLPPLPDNPPEPPYQIQPAVTPDERADNTDIEPTEAPDRKPQQTTQAYGTLQSTVQTLTEKTFINANADKPDPDGAEGTEIYVSAVTPTTDEEKELLAGPDIIHDSSKSALPPPFYRIIGCAFNAYIIVELEDRVMIVDKHAAHERILFEEMKRNMSSSGVSSQILLLPVSLSATAPERDALERYRTEIESTGLEYTLDEQSVSLTAYPSQLDIDESSAMLQSLAGGLADGTQTVGAEKSVAFERALYQASCKAAMKAGREDGEENIRWIAESLLTLSDIRYCPHGRPVAYDLTKHEIEKQFKRI